MTDVKQQELLYARAVYTIRQLAEPDSDILLCEGDGGRKGEGKGEKSEGRDKEGVVDEQMRDRVYYS